MPAERPSAVPRLPAAPGLAALAPLAGAAPLAAAPPLTAHWADQLALPAFLLAAEGLAATAAWMEKALEAHTRSGLLQAADEADVPERAAEILRRLPTFLLSARILRFLAKAALVVGVASWALGDALREGLAGGGGIVPVPWTALGLALLLAFLVNFVVNDVLVGVLARRSADRRLLASLGLLRAMAVVTAPVRVPLRLLVRAVFRVSLEEPEADAREEVLDSVSEAEEEGTLSPTEAGMIHGVIGLSGRVASEVLIPRSQVSMLQADQPLAQAIAFAAEDGHTRLPVYGRDRDDVLGWVHARDLLRHAGTAGAEATPVRSILREAFFVPDSKPLDELFDELRERKVHLAIVVNDVGATAGIVTLEDLLEQIVGEIDDEHDTEAGRGARSEELGRGDVHLDAHMRMDDVNQLLRLGLPVQPGAYETLGGLLLHRLGHVPRPGETLSLEGATLTVAEADARRVTKVRVQVRRGPSAAPSPPRSA